MRRRRRKTADTRPHEPRTASRRQEQSGLEPGPSMGECPVVFVENESPADRNVHLQMMNLGAQNVSSRFGTGAVAKNPGLENRALRRQAATAFALARGANPQGESDQCRRPNLGGRKSGSPNALDLVPKAGFFNFRGGPSAKKAGQRGAVSGKNGGARDYMTFDWHIPSQKPAAHGRRVFALGRIPSGIRVLPFLAETSR